jgi:hypothetical protein
VDKVHCHPKLREPDKVRGGLLFSTRISFKNFYGLRWTMSTATRSFANLTR